MESQPERIPFIVRAQALLDFCDGLEAGGLEDYARRTRAITREALDLAAQLAACQGALEAMRIDRDRWRDERWREVHGTPWPR